MNILPRTNCLLALAVTVLFLQACSKERVGVQDSILKGETARIAEFATQKNFGRHFTVFATIVKVCPTEGCWIRISDSVGDTLLCKRADDNFKFPAHWNGLKVRVSGVLEEVVARDELTKEVVSSVQLLTHEAALIE